MPSKFHGLTSNKSLSASISTASCSSPKEFTQAVPPQEAVLTLKEIVLKASPIHIINLIKPLSGVAFVRNSSYTRNKWTRSNSAYLSKVYTSNQSFTRQIFSGTFLKLQLTRLSPISHLVTRDDCFVFEAFNDDLGTCFSDSPKRELDFRLCPN